MIDRSRHIPETVCRTLIQEARGRCCLCRELVLEGSERHRAISDVLEKHHIIYFSQGGEHTPENLLLVDPNCHRLIHQRPKDYPIEVLQKAKKRWIDIGSHLPSQILYEGSPPQLSNQEQFRLAYYPFTFETYGLKYNIIAPDSLRVSQFATFLKQRIVNVIAAIDDNQAFIEAERFYLSRRNATTGGYSNAMLLRDIGLDNDELVLNIHVHVVARAMQSDRVTLEAIPGNPKAGEKYEITINHTFRESLPVTVTVQGTDGYKLFKEGITSDGRFSVTVPGAADGVEDSIMIYGEFGSLRLRLIFGGEASQHANS